MDASHVLRQARARAGLSQRGLAQEASTSGPAVAAYESGGKQPRVDTFVRLLSAAGAELSVRPARSRNDRFVDLLCEQLANRVLEDPELLEHARRALPRLEGRSRWVESWRLLLAAGPEAVAAVLTSTSPAARGLKADTPLALVVELPERQRAELQEAARAA